MLFYIELVSLLERPRWYPILNYRTIVSMGRVLEKDDSIRLDDGSVSMSFNEGNLRWSLSATGRVDSVLSRGRTICLRALPPHGTRLTKGFFGGSAADSDASLRKLPALKPGFYALSFPAKAPAIICSKVTIISTCRSFCGLKQTRLRQRHALYKRAVTAPVNH
jgi:hypothetical protein